MLYSDIERTYVTNPTDFLRAKVGIVILDGTDDFPLIEQKLVDLILVCEFEKNDFHCLDKLRALCQLRIL